jgi:type IV pilus assembly protein PilN
MIYINLLPVREAQRRARFFAQLSVAIVALGITIAACFGLYVVQATQISKKQDDIQTAQSEIFRLKKTIGEVAGFKKKQAELQGKLDILAQLKEKKNGPVHLLDDLSRILPAKLWVNSYKESGGNISIAGVGLNEETVATFLRDLEASAYYKDVELKVTKQTTKKSLKFQEFSVACKVETPTKKKAE